MRSIIASLIAALCAFTGPSLLAQTVCPPTFDQNYQFTSADSQTARIELVGVGSSHTTWSWPAFLQIADSGLLWVAVHGKPDSSLTIRLSSSDIVSEQTFPPGSAGLRALNVSSFTKLAAGALVHIAVTNGKVGCATATLSLFGNHLGARKNVLVLAPHPDDAEIAAFGFYAGHNSTVVTVTAGNAGDFNYCQTAPDRATHYRLKGELRVIDSITVPWQGGVPVSRAFNLGYFDGTMHTMRDNPQMPVKELFVDNDDVLPYRRFNQTALLRIASRKATWNNLVADLRSVLMRVRPVVVVTPDPRSDSHLDHQLTTVALAQALDKTSLRLKILLYTNHAGGDQHPMGTTGQDVTLPPWCGSKALSAAAFYAHPLTAEVQRRKLMALESMHDLRLAPSAQYEFGPNGDTRCQTHPGAVLGPSSYFRRAVRSHELFLVTDRVGLQAIVRKGWP